MIYIKYDDILSLLFILFSCQWFSKYNIKNIDTNHCDKYLAFKFDILIIVLYISVIIVLFSIIFIRNM